MSIGDLAQATGVAVATLRMWESRYGFPRSPRRTASGHRRYQDAQVAQVDDVVRRRGRGLRLEAAIAAVNADAARATSSVHAVLSREHPEQPRERLVKSTLVALSTAIEDELSANAACGHLFGAFQTELKFQHALSRWEELARAARTTIALANFSHASPSPPPPDDIERVALAQDAPLLREWVVVNDSPILPVALSAWELPGQQEVPDSDRVFESIWTVDPRAVRAASVTCAGVAASAGSALARDLLDGDLAGPPAPLPPLLAVTRLAHRMIAHVATSHAS